MIQINEDRSALASILTGSVEKVEESNKCQEAKAQPVSVSDVHDDFRRLMESKGLDENIIRDLWHEVERAGLRIRAAYRELTRKEPKVDVKYNFGSVQKFGFLSGAMEDSLEHLSLSGVLEKLEDISYEISQGNLSSIETADLLHAKDLALDDIENTSREVEKLKKQASELGAYGDKLGAWYTKQKGTLEKQRLAIISSLVSSIGEKDAVKFGAKPYNELSRPLQKQLDIALTMRQVAINVDSWMLPCGSDNVSKSPELLGTSKTSPDESRGETDKLWNSILSKVTNALPPSFGMRVVAENIIARGVTMLVKGVGPDTASVIFHFEGEYQIILRKIEGLPPFIMAKLNIRDEVVPVAFGDTRHKMDVSVSFPKQSFE